MRARVTEVVLLCADGVVRGGRGSQEEEEEAQQVTYRQVSQSSQYATPEAYNLC